jgi:hypothetical protein
MPEVQKANSQNGETAQRFIEFIMMQAQQAMLFLGRLPHPSTGETMVNLEAARMFIDYIDMLKEKTRGNLSNDEEKVLGSILSDLQISFVQVSKDNLADQTIPNQEPESTEPDSKIEESASSQEDQKKRFSKSYGEL